MKLLKYVIRLIYTASLVYFVNSIWLKWLGISTWFMIPAGIIFLMTLIFPTIDVFRVKKKRFKLCAYGSELLKIFILSVIIAASLAVAGLFQVVAVPAFDVEPVRWTLAILWGIVVEAIVFWIGIGSVYVSSTQLGLKHRILGIALGWIPIAHLICLGVIIEKTSDEITYQIEYEGRNRQRKNERVCETKYPILMVHGVFFRDFKYLNYWGRIPEALEENGAKIFYGNHQSAASVESCGKELAERIKKIRETTGCEKVNIIAHSKGGLDARYAIAKEGMAPYVATLTTINTPHRGCEFADYLLSKISRKKQEVIAKTYQTALKKLGDENPDFMAAVTDLTASACEKRNESVLDDERVSYRSVGSKLNKARSGRFPLNMTHHLVKHFDGANDGLVGEKSFSWGESYEFLTVRGKRGISHGDMIDLNHENIKEFNVIEFYIDLVAKLKNQGF